MLTEPELREPVDLPSRQHARATLRLIDRCLDQIELLHLQGTYLARQMGCRKVLALVEDACGGPLPSSVVASSNSYALHAALVDWQGALMDQMLPGRRHRFPDLEADGEAWVVPRVRRLLRRAASSGSAVDKPAATNRSALAGGGDGGRELVGVVRRTVSELRPAPWPHASAGPDDARGER